ncbi:sulfite exporter TauE/SafE family protein [Streptosporangium lutulentum]
MYGRAGGLLAGLVSRGGPACDGSRRTSREPSGPAAVSLFLAGRSGSHLVAGALLGLASSAVQLGPEVRAALLVVAGVAVMVFGVRMFGREPAGCAPHRAVSPVTVPGGRTIASGVGAIVPGVRAVLLGAATILLPCGVTLSMEVVAVSSGSALGGAAVMAGFVVGTAPAFALLGLALRRAATTRLAALAGIVALATGIWTVTSGLSLGGWLPGSGGSPSAAAAVRADGTQRIDVWATGRGYRPGVVTARAGVPVEIAFHLGDAPGCTRTLTIDGRDMALPATVRLDPRPPGSLRYVCSMGMYVGFVTFR